jgi:hypothetical protein
MSFLWQEALWALLLLPLLVLAYVWLLRRRKKSAVTWASLGIVKEALGGQRAWRRHVPPALLLLALTALVLATARPTPRSAATMWSPPSTASSCSAAPPSAAASCCRWPRSSPTQASTCRRSPASA